MTWDENNFLHICQSIYFHISDARFGHTESTAINKLTKASIKGRLDQTRVSMGLARGVKTFNSAKTAKVKDTISTESSGTEGDTNSAKFEDICRQVV